MSTAPLLWIYLDAPTLDRVRAGQHNFFGRLIGAVEGAGWQVNLRESSLAERLAAPGREGYALYHMEEPTYDRALTCRRAYVGAFWRIERVATRWDWPVAKAQFQPETVDATEATRFTDDWRKRLYSSGKPSSDEGFCFLPLQGRLLETRSFQAMSPVKMLEETLARTDLPVMATLHPRESYTAEEIAALDTLVARHPRLSVQKGGSDAALRGCRFVVTQNSSLAFEGYFHHKPAVLFARIDFHHIAGSVPRDGIDVAFASLKTRPEFDSYLFWFLQKRALNAGRPEFEAALLDHLRKRGWPI
ncbi:hypothetical protein LZA78_11395 [Sinirhodobacter sp. WL0062]|uniref:Capsular biosynthesis protein n=1 Tax=Rhodobacter flavimaris TaxID=2907145 RepID=A0ABS8Z013_9RHOB|nr:hypothetical protein [Sinirhodobacter sp. WL0062]MCE5974089.1 hypothetical protein [Sinirhodobacter sp. WL0062]